MAESLKTLADLDRQPRPVLDDLSIVIPTLGRPILEQCLHSFAASDHWPSSLIVVDQSRSAHVEAWMATLRELGLGVEYVPSDQRGRSAGLNRGLERVTTRFVAVTDDECFATPDWMRRLIERLRAEPDRIITGRVELAGDDEMAFSVVTLQTPRIYHRPELKVHPLIGANMGVAMRNVARIGPFDEHPTIACAEDSDWGHRALRAGIPIVYDPEILVLHYHWRDAGQRTERYHEYSRSIGGFYGKFLLSGDGMIWLQTLRDLVRAPIRWVRGIVKGDSDMIDRGRSDTVELPPGILAALRRRRDVPGQGVWSEV